MSSCPGGMGKPPTEVISRNESQSPIFSITPKSHSIFSWRLSIFPKNSQHGRRSIVLCNDFRLCQVKYYGTKFPGISFSTSFWSWNNTPVIEVWVLFSWVWMSLWQSDATYSEVRSLGETASTWSFWGLLFLESNLWEIPSTGRHCLSAFQSAASITYHMWKKKWSPAAEYLTTQHERCQTKPSQPPE